MWNYIKNHKRLFSGVSSTILIITLLAVFAPQIHVALYKTNDKNSNSIGNTIAITIGGYGVGATGNVDYPLSGTSDNVVFASAIAALPVTGGELIVTSPATGFSTINFVGTVSVPENVMIVGSGNGTSFSCNNSTPLFTAVGNYTSFQNLKTDAGGISMGTTVGWTWYNININGTLYTEKSPNSSLVDSSLNAPTGRTASYVIATSDASAPQKSQADDTLTGTNDYIKLQADINTAQAGGGGVIQIVGNNVILGTTGITLSAVINATTLDFRGVNIQYSGTGNAITNEQATAATKIFNNQIIGGTITATGAAITSATAVGISTKQWQYGYIKCTFGEFHSGTAVKFQSGANSGDFAENNHFNLYINNCKNGIQFTGGGGTDYNTIDFLVFIPDTSDAGGTAVLTNDSIGTRQLEIAKANIWLHQNNTIGLDLTLANNFHISSINFEGSTLTGCTCIKTEDVSNGSIDNLIASGGTGNDKVFSLYQPASGTPSCVKLWQYKITYMNANFAGVSLNYPGVEINANPCMTSNITYYYDGSAGTMAWDAGEGSPDVGCLSYICAAANTDETIYGMFGAKVAIIPNSPITILARVKTVTLKTQIAIGVTTFDAADNFLDNYLMGNVFVVQVADGWSILAWNSIIPANARKISIYILVQKGDSTTKTYIDSVQVRTIQ